ncbi:MAG TPA: ATP-binding protein, partial [Vicinamibacteria bacterium]|nr:ATP-binding protein [Vicinamibacteria bacterium]
GILLALTAIRVRRPSGPSGGPAAVPVPPGTSEYVHFATGIAHELNNPLMAVGGWAELALRKSEPRESLEALLEATRRATQAVRRLQQLGRAADAPSSSAAAAVSAAEASSPAAPLARGGVTPRVIVVGTLLFAAAYFMATPLGAPAWVADALLLLPPAAAALASWERGRAAATGRRAAFWRLLAAGAAVWVAGQVLWLTFDWLGIPPQQGGGRLVELLFFAFLVPVLAALGLRAHPKALRRDPAAWPDSVFLAAAVLYLFVRLPVVSALALSEPLATKRVLLGALCATVTVWASVLWRFADDPSWRRTYGAIAAFAMSYGALAVFANGLGGRMPAPGGWADLAWFVPFAFLLAAAGPGVGLLNAYPALLIAGTGPVILDLALRDRLPPLGVAASLTAICALLLAGAAALRLRWQVEVDRGSRKEARLQTEELQRAGRLTALASLVAAAVGDLEDLLEEVSRRARAASVVMPDKGEQMLQQARRARDIVRDLSNAFRLVPPGPRRDLDLVSLVEEVVEAALDEGLALHVSLEDLAGLPMVHGDPRALSAAISHLLRNAAQASPGGVLRIRGALREGEVELSFADDGPGVPEALRTQIFDPFFTTRRVGEGVGLGL